MAVQVLLKYPVVFLVAFCVTYLLTPLVAQTSRRLGIVDHPNERRINQTPVPRCGGIAVFLGFHAGCAAVFLLPWAPFQGNLNVEWYRHFILVSCWILTIGVLDDVLSLSPLAKLSGQTIAAILFYFGGFTVSNLLGFPLPGAVDFAVTTFWYLALINAFNLIDGLDGLAAGLGTIAAIGIAGSMLFSQQPGSVLILLALAASCLAFLRFNFHPARVYLGDTGSMFIGAAIAAMALGTGAKGSAMASIGIPLLAAGVPLFDTMLAVWRRSLRRFGNTCPNAKVMGADLEHLHHRLLKTGLTQRKVATLLYGVNALFVAIGIVSMTYSSHQAGLFLLSFVLASYVVVKHVAHTELWDSGTLIVRGLRRPRGKVFAAVLYPAVDFVALVVSLGITLLLIRPELPWSALKQEWLAKTALWCAIPFILIALSGTYSRVWSRARISEYFGLALTLFAVIAGTLGFRLFITTYMWHDAVLKAVLHFSLSGMFIVGVRAFPRAVSDFMSIYADRREGNTREVARRILVYGAGERGILFLRESNYHAFDHGMRAEVIGLLDDDANLRKRKVHGYQVLGGLGEIRQILAKDPFDELVIACDVAKESLESLMDLAEESGIGLSVWQANYTQLYRPFGETLLLPIKEESLRLGA